MLKLVEEYGRLWLLEKVAAAYESRHGAPPFDISHWDPSEATTKLLLKHLSLPVAAPWIPYIYTYNFNKHSEVIRRLVIGTERQSCLLVPGGTNAILSAIWWLKSLDIDSLAIVCPSYFSVFHACDIVGLPYRHIYMSRIGGEWLFPTDQIDLFMNNMPSAKAIWLTNPIYCTGVKQSDSLRPFINSLLDRGAAVVVDECLCAPSQSFARHLSGNKLVSIFSPHKTISMNALKFSALVFNERHEDFFESWSDVLVGGVAASTFTAIQHFCSDNFVDLQSVFFSHIDSARKDVIRVANRYSQFIEFDKETAGHYMTFYIPRIKGARGMEMSFVERMIHETGTLIIPGVMNHFDPEIAFSFRVNLARSSVQLFGALSRVMEYLTSNC
jgi:hypothetical protein